MSDKFEQSQIQSVSQSKIHYLEDLLGRVYKQCGNHCSAERRHCLTPSLRDEIQNYLLEASGATEATIQSGAESSKSCQMKTIDRLERSMTQLTLGDLIKKLEAMPQGTLVANLCKPKSYRGYYEDLAFSKHDGRRLASQFLHDCKNFILNHTFHGYKSGEYTMDALTPLWIAEYGETGVRLLDVFSDGSIMTG